MNTSISLADPAGAVFVVPPDFSPDDVHPDLWALAQLPGLLRDIDPEEFAAAVGDWPRSPTHAELEADLIEIRNGRGEATQDFGAETAAQSGRFDHCFITVLSLSAQRHPNTLRLISLAMLMAGVCGMHHKLKLMRPRPAQVWPGLLPLLPTPPHPAFPSNHAAQSYCTAEMLKAAFGAGSAFGPYLDQLAARISINRERAGLHFRSDTVSGQALGVALAARLASHPIVAAAAQELGGASAIPVPNA